jgi:AcrR family transcriptional regulator
MQSARRVSKEELVRRFRTEEILSAAGQVISRRGIQGASLEQIARAAGVAKGTIYLYFTSKDDLVCQVLEAWHSGLLQAIEEAGSARGSARERLNALVKAHLRFSKGHRDLLRTCFIEGFSGARRRPSGVLRRLRAMHRRYEEIVARVITEGIRAGEFRRVNARGAASFLLEILRADNLPGVSGDEPMDPEARASELLDIYFHGVIK